MSNSGDIGISPVLLQAISQSLSSPSHKSNTPVNTNMESSNLAPGGAADQNLAERLIKDQQGNVNVLNTSEESTLPLQSDTIKTMLKIKMAANALSKSANAMQQIVTSRDDLKHDKKETVQSSASDIAMANMLTALASQNNKTIIAPTSDTGSTVLGQNGGSSQSSSNELKESDYRTVHIGNKKLLIRSKVDLAESELNQQTMVSSENNNAGTSANETVYTIIKPEPGVGSVRIQSSESNLLVSDSNLHSNISIGHVDESVVSGKSNVTDSLVLTDTQSASGVTSGESGAGTQLVFSFNPNPGTSEIVQDARLKVIEHDGKRYILQTHAYDATQVAEAQAEEPQSYTVQIGTDETVTYTSVAEQEVVTVGQQQEEAANVSGFKSPLSGSPCPICGDNVSGEDRICPVFMILIIFVGLCNICSSVYS